MLEYLTSLTEKEVKELITAQKNIDNPKDDTLNIGDYVVYTATNRLEADNTIFRIKDISENSYLMEYGSEFDNFKTKGPLLTFLVHKFHYPTYIKRLTYEDLIQIKLARLHKSIFPKTISGVRLYLTKILNGVYGEERYEIKDILYPLIKKDLPDGRIITENNENRIISRITLYYPRIIISNSVGTTHTIKDLFFSFSLCFLVERGTIEMKDTCIRRTTFSDDEYLEESNLFYIFSHCQLEQRPWINGATSVCFGSSSANPIIQKFRASNGKITDLEMLFHSINLYLEWESIEGTPYFSIRNLGNVRKRYELHHLSQMFLNRTANTVITILMNKMKDYPLEELSDFSLTINDADCETTPSTIHFFNFNIDKEVNEIMVQLKEEKPIMMLDSLFCYIYGDTPTLLDSNLENPNLTSIITASEKKGIDFRGQFYPVKIEIMRQETLDALKQSLKKTVHPDFILIIKQMIASAFIHYLTTEKPYVI